LNPFYNGVFLVYSIQTPFVNSYLSNSVTEGFYWNIGT